MSRSHLLWEYPSSTGVRITFGRLVDDREFRLMVEFCLLYLVVGIRLIRSMIVFCHFYRVVWIRLPPLIRSLGRSIVGKWNNKFMVAWYK